MCVKVCVKVCEGVCVCGQYIQSSELVTQLAYRVLVGEIGRERERERGEERDREREAERERER